LIPGDADGDQDVDKDDAARMAQNWGATELVSPYMSMWEMGDFDDDGLVGPRDAAILAANWGYGASEASSVPEPSVLSLLGAALVLLTLRRRIV
jgi:hypothetical protein